MSRVLYLDMIIEFHEYVRLDQVQIMFIYIFLNKKTWFDRQLNETALRKRPNDVDVNSFKLESP